LTWHYRPALELIRLLYEISGASDASPGVSAPDYLFDMNVFWQAVLSRLFHDHLPPAIGHVADERRLVDLMRYAPDANPRRRRAPAPRPDFALICDGRPRLFLDAKYRDVWTQGYPADWIYQLGIYAVAAPSRVAIMLYPTEDRAARAEKIEIIDPLRRNHVAVVILKPVIVSQLAQHVSAARKAHAQTAAVKFVVGLVTV
jgi:5-methylcytosine-specific restriction enzyme subunit McrC